MLHIAASLENKSEHPLGKAITHYFNIKDLFEVENFHMIIGKGVPGSINGKKVLACNLELLYDEKVVSPSNWIDNYIFRFTEKGSTIIYLAIDKMIVGAIILDDTLRKDANNTINKIKNKELKTILITGDNEKSDEYVASKVGIEKVYSNSLPENKMKIINNYQENDKKVVMIGAGVNDALSLKNSFVEIAMSKIGSEISIAAADITLINDDINYIPHLLGISKKLIRTIINMTISLALNFIAIILAVLGI